MTNPKSVRTEILCDPAFVEQFRTFAQANDIVIEDIASKKEQTYLQFGIIEVAAVIAIIQGGIFISKEFAKLLERWMKNNPNQKIVIRTMVASEEITAGMTEMEIQLKLQNATGLLKEK
ncbi:MAG: hypothetical protein ACE5KZ_00585 [Candidatus Scalinduaceae bacterium]